MAKDTTELPWRISEVFKITTSGRLGLILVDLPKNITTSVLHTPLPFRATAPGQPLGLLKNPLRSKDRVLVDMFATKQATDMASRAQRPIIYLLAFPSQSYPPRPAPQDRQHSRHYEPPGLGSLQ